MGNIFAIYLIIGFVIGLFYETRSHHVSLINILHKTLFWYEIFLPSYLCISNLLSFIIKKPINLFYFYLFEYKLKTLVLADPNGNYYFKRTDYNQISRFIKKENFFEPDNLILEQYDMFLNILIKMVYDKKLIFIKESDLLS